MAGNQKGKLSARSMLRRRYLLGLSLLILVLSSSEIYIQGQLKRQRDHVHWINVAGNQRMLSAQLGGLATESQIIDGRVVTPHELVDAVKKIEGRQELLEREYSSIEGTDMRPQDLAGLFGDSAERLTRLVAEVEMASDLGSSQGTTQPEISRAHANRIKEAQLAYLSAQITLVSAMEREAESTREGSRRIEALRALLIALVLLAEAVFIFLPADRSLGEFIAEQQRQKDYAEDESRTVSKLNHELETTLVRLLDGSSPICANCKSIRQDDGTWKSIEEVLSAKSRAMLSHGVCEPCAALLYPELDLSSSGSGHGTQSDV